MKKKKHAAPFAEFKDDAEGAYQLGLANGLSRAIRILEDEPGTTGELLTCLRYVAILEQSALDTIYRKKKRFNSGVPLKYPEGVDKRV